MTTQSTITKHARLALFWSVLGGLSALAALPYVLALNPGVAEELGVVAVAIAQPLQLGVLMFLGGWLGLRLGAQIGLDSPWARALVYGTQRPSYPTSRWLVAGIIGIVVGFLVLGLDAAVFTANMPQANVDLEAVAVARWKGLLGSFYGGIAEELLTRLIAMTLLTWGAWRFLARRQTPPPAWTFVTGILVAGILFGLGHLPTAASVWGLTPIVIIRSVVLNLLPAVAFGGLYWRWGLEYAMVAHFAADLVLRGLGV